jgi:hypothetical protein
MGRPFTYHYFDNRLFTVRPDPVEAFTHRDIVSCAQFLGAAVAIVPIMDILHQVRGE